MQKIFPRRHLRIWCLGQLFLCRLLERFPWRIITPGGSTFRERTGGTPKDRIRPLPAAKNIRLFRSRGKMRKCTRNGPESVCPAKPSGSARREEGWTGNRTFGGRKNIPATKKWQISGRENFPPRILEPMGFKALRRWAVSP